jgi:outer membrane protein assembly factor BamB
MRPTILPRHALDLAAACRYTLFFFAVLLISNIFVLPTASAAHLPTQRNSLHSTPSSQRSSERRPTHRTHSAAAPSPSFAWRHRCDAAIEADGAFAADGNFYVGCLGGTLYAIEPHAGRRLWQFKAGGAIFAAPLVAADGRSQPFPASFPPLFLTFCYQAEACC